MLTIDSKNYPDFAKYEGYLNEGRRVYFDLEKLKKRAEISASYLKSLQEELELFMYIETQGGYSRINSTNVVRYLLEIAHVPPFYLGEKLDKYGKLTHSLAKGKLEKIRNLGYAKEFLDLYSEYIKLKTSKERIYKLISRMKPVENEENLRCSTFRMSVAGTGRYCTKEENIQAIEKNYLDCITERKDRFLFWADFDQMDLRVLWNIFLSEGGKEEEIFQETNDKYEAMARIMDLHNNRPFDREKFKKNRDTKYKVGTLARGYGMTLQNLIEKTGDEDFARYLDNYFISNKRYSRYLQAIDTVISNGESLTVYDYFGVKREIGRGSATAIKNAGLNTPIQATSNSVMMFLVNAVMDKFRSLGFGKDDVFVYLIRHDEFLLSFSNRMKKHIHILNDFMEVAVDNWSTLTLEPKVGYSYKIPDDELMKYLKNDTTPLTPRKPIEGKQYFPIKHQRKLDVYIDKNRYLIYDSEVDKTYMGETKGNVILQLKRFIETELNYTDCKTCEVLVQNYKKRIYNVTHNGVTFEYYYNENKTLESKFYSVFGA